MKQLIAITIIMVAIMGCKSPTAQRQAVNTLYSLHVTADKALDSYLDLVIQGKVKTNGVPAVAQQYGLFQLAYNAALLAVASNTNATAPAEVLQTVIELQNIVKEAK